MPVIRFFQIFDKCFNHWTKASLSCSALGKVLAITLSRMPPKESKSSLAWGLRHTPDMSKSQLEIFGPTLKINELESGPDADRWHF